MPLSLRIEESATARPVVIPVGHEPANRRRLAVLLEQAGDRHVAGAT